MQQLTDAFCKFVLLYNIVAVNLSSLNVVELIMYGK